MIENLNPIQSYELLQQNKASVLVDVRTKIEHSFVGHPIGAIHIPWKEFPTMQINESFIREVEKIAPDKTAPILLLCRSGQRSLDAAKALEAYGYKHLVNITDGLEGPLDGSNHRGNIGGWRYNKLPWQQS